MDYLCKENLMTREVLTDLYLTKRKTMNEICELTGVASPITVARYIKKYGIKARNTNFEKSLINKLKITDEEFKQTLIQLYVNQRVSQNRLAEIYGVSRVIIKKYLKKYGILTRNHKEANKINNSGHLNPNWNGGRHICGNGYIEVLCPDHPFPHRGSYVYEHRLVMEKSIGRYLTSDEVVHHINEDKTDNLLENLMLFTNEEHLKHHAKLKSSC